MDFMIEKMSKLMPILLLKTKIRNCFMPNQALISPQKNFIINHKKNNKGQSAAEYVIVLLLAVVIVGATYDLFSRALGSFYNRLLSARSGTTGMAP